MRCNRFLLYLLVILLIPLRALAADLFPVYTEEGGGYIDRTGSIVLAPQYETVTEYRGGQYAVVSILDEMDEERFGIIDAEGTFVLEPEYDWIEYESSGIPGDEGVFCVYSIDPDRIGCFDLGSGYFTGCVYEEISPLSDPDYLMVTAIGGVSAGYIRRTDGETVFSFVFSPAESTGFINGWAWMKENGMPDGVWVYRDGQTLVPPEGYEIVFGPVFDLPVLIRNQNDQKYAYYDFREKSIIATDFDDAEPFEDGYAAARRGDSSWELIDLTGKSVLRFDADHICQVWQEGILVDHRNRLEFISLSGEQNFSIGKQPQYGIYAGSSPYIVFYDLSAVTSKYGLNLVPIGVCDAEGKDIIRMEEGYLIDLDDLDHIRYDHEELFPDGLLCLFHEDRFGYLNDKGETIIPFHYDYAEQFNRGLAYVLEDEIGHYLDAAGTVVW